MICFYLLAALLILITESKPQEPDGAGTDFYWEGCSDGRGLRCGAGLKPCWEICDCQRSCTGEVGIGQGKNFLGPKVGSDICNQPPFLCDISTSNTSTSQECAETCSQPLDAIATAAAWVWSDPTIPGVAEPNKCTCKNSSIVEHTFVNTPWAVFGPTNPIIGLDISNQPPFPADIPGGLQDNFADCEGECRTKLEAVAWVWSDPAVPGVAEPKKCTCKNKKIKQFPWIQTAWAVAGILNTTSNTKRKVVRGRFVEWPQVGSIRVNQGSWSGGSSVIKFEPDSHSGDKKYFSADGKKFLAPVTATYNVSIGGIEKATGGNFGRIFLNVNPGTEGQRLIPLVKQKEKQFHRLSLFGHSDTHDAGEDFAIWILSHSASGILKDLSLLIEWCNIC